MTELDKLCADIERQILENMGMHPSEAYKRLRVAGYLPFFQQKGKKQ